MTMTPKASSTLDQDLQSVCARRGKVLVVEGDPSQQRQLRQVLEKCLDVTVVGSGHECLEIVDSLSPDLVLLDVPLSGWDGLETCRILRVSNHVPVLIVSARDTPEDRLEALESGCSDFIVKPFDAKVLLHKSLMAVEALRERNRLEQEKAALQSLLLAALTTVGERGILIDFQRGLAACLDHASLAAHIVETAAAYNIDVQVQVRGKGTSVTRTREGLASPLEESVIKHVAALGAIFQFKQRLVVNFASVTVLVTNMPVDDEERYQRMQDNVTLLAEGAQSAAEAIDVWSESGKQIEGMQVVSFESHYAVDHLKLRYWQQQQDIRSLLQRLIDKVENNYVFLGLTESQEATLSGSVRDAADEIRTLLEQGQADFESKFDAILKLLKPGDKGDVEFF